MFKGYKLLKKYYSLSGLKIGIIIFQFILLLIPSILSIFTPFLTANIISSLTVFDFSKAVYIIIINFIIVVLSSFFYFLYHLISRTINKTLYQNFNNFLYENIKKNKNINVINLPTITNVATCIEFNKNFLFKLCFFIKAVITLIIIFFYNYILCFVIILVSLVSYFLLRITDKKIQNKTKALSDIQQKSLDLFNNIHKGSDVEESYNLNVILKNKYFNLVDKQAKTSNQISLYYNINNNFISLILKTTVFAISIFLINQIKLTTLTLSLYLILSPYLTSSAQNLISFFDLFSEFGNIENILNDFESLKFKNEKQIKQKIDLSNFNLYIYQLNYKNETSSLKNITLEISFGKLIFIKSNNKNNLSSLFKIIQRNTNLDSGTIFLDNKNISDIPIECYRKIITSTNINPFFFNISLIENLIMVCNNKSFIEKSIKDFKLKSIIQNFPQGQNTIITEDINKELLFLLGILRCYVAKSKIICIENIPEFLTDEYKLLFDHILLFLKNKSTIIIFSYKNTYEVDADKKFTLENGNLKEYK